MLFCYLIWLSFCMRCFQVLIFFYDAGAKTPETAQLSSQVTFKQAQHRKEWRMTSLEIWEQLICACLVELKQSLKVKLLRGWEILVMSSMHILFEVYTLGWSSLLFLWEVFDGLVRFSLLFFFIFGLPKLGFFHHPPPYKTTHKRIWTLPNHKDKQWIITDTTN